MPIPTELAAACPGVATAGAADVIAGRAARWVAAPASTEEAAAVLRAAAVLGLAVVPRGAGRLQHWGNPPDHCDLIVDTRRLDRVVAHDPADFSVTVQAGVRLSDLARVVESARQSLALLPPLRALRGTVGGLIATNAAGGRRYRYGTPRDRLTGITVVRADGAILRSRPSGPSAGRRDLMSLFAGSYGTLGLITEATLRLEPLPRGSRGVWLPCTHPEHAVRLAEAVADPALAATGINLRWRADGSLGLVVTIAGDRDDLQARAERLYGLAGRPAPPLLDPARAVRLDAPDHGGLPTAVAQRLLAQRDRIQGELQDPPPDTGTLVRVSFPSAQLAAVLTMIRAMAASCGIGTAISGSVGAGVLEVKVPAESPAAAVARFVTALRAEPVPARTDGAAGNTGTDGAAGTATAQVVVLYAPDEIRDLTAGPGPAPASIQAVKDEFDPEHRMAPGRLADASS